MAPKHKAEPDETADKANDNKSQEPAYRRTAGPNFTVEELEEELICWACCVYEFPEFSPILDKVETLLADAGSATAKAKAILDVECAKLGCDPINSLADLRKLEEARKKRGVRFRPRALGTWSRGRS